MAEDRSQAQAIRGGAAAETIAAIATPPGTSALGLVRVTGPKALPIARSLLGTSQEALAPRVAALATASGPDGPIDSVLATYFPGPASATGEDIVELSAHGSPFILKRLLEALLSAGARLAEPGEFTLRSYLNGRMDLAQAEAVCELIRAKTSGAHRAALAQLGGGLSRVIGSIRTSLLELLTRLEASLDHPEEDIPALDAAVTAAEIKRIEARISALADTHRSGRLYASGARVCIVGRPNAGKSSLLNALLGRQRAIVCPEPGTTRDTIEETFELRGMPAVLIDTAGLRETPESAAENAGLERTRQALAACDLALLVMDGSRPVEPEDRRVHETLLAKAAELGRPLVRVAAKSDLPMRPDHPPTDVSISALTGSGLDALRKRIADHLITDSPSEIVILSVRHELSLKTAAAALNEAISAIGDDPRRWEDKAAHCLHKALRRLDEITGTGAPDEVLREIFSRYCFGN